jgi:hypothetical protein
MAAVPAASAARPIASNGKVPAPVNGSVPRDPLDVPVGVIAPVSFDAVSPSTALCGPVLLVSPDTFAADVVGVVVVIPSTVVLVVLAVPLPATVVVVVAGIEVLVTPATVVVVGRCVVVVVAVPHVTLNVS